MILQVFLLLAALGWLYWKGYLGPNAMRKLALFASVALGVWLLAKGQFAAGALWGLAVAAVAFKSRLRRRLARIGADETEARMLLGVGIRASREEILAAHRRRIADVHPDRNGDLAHDAASKVNAARDLLLSRLQNP